MPRHNEDLAAAFDEMADLLSLQGGNAFRIRAYRRAAQVVRAQPEELTVRIARGFDPDTLPGIGADLAGKIREFLRTGRMPALEKLRKAIPAGLRDLLGVRGLGPRRVQVLHEKLRIENLTDLHAALESGRLRAVPGFGPGLEAQLRRAITTAAVTERRTLRTTAEPYADSLRRYLRAQPGVSEVEIAGSFRRGSETVGDLDVVVCGDRKVDLGALVSGHDETARVLDHGETRATIVLHSGLQVDVRLVSHESFGSALHYFTGSKAHNLHLRRIAQERGYKLNEYGLFRGSRRLAGDTEESIFAALGMQPIPPELREDRGEIEAAQARRLPRLLEPRQLRGDLHAHTEASDGTASLEQMIEGARRAGLEYVAITDHSKHIGAVHGLDAQALAEQIDAIDRLNPRLTGIEVLKGAEVDVLESGDLALPDEILRRLDVVVIAVHSHFELPRRRQTDRLLRAIDHRYVSVLAHPAARLLGERPPIEVDWARVIERAAARPLYFEINAQPARLDLDDRLAREAAERGALLCISSDAHSASGFSVLRGGVTQARRAWLDADRIVNCRPLAALRPLLARTFV